MDFTISMIFMVGRGLGDNVKTHFFKTIQFPKKCVFILLAKPTSFKNIVKKLSKLIISKKLGKLSIHYHRN